MPCDTLIGNLYNKKSNVWDLGAHDRVNEYGRTWGGGGFKCTCFSDVHGIFRREKKDKQNWTFFQAIFQQLEYWNQQKNVFHSDEMYS